MIIVHAVIHFVLVIGKAVHDVSTHQVEFAVHLQHAENCQTVKPQLDCQNLIYVKRASWVVAQFP